MDAPYYLTLSTDTGKQGLDSLMIARRTVKLLFFLVIVCVFVGPFARTAGARLSVEEEKELGEKFLKAVLQQLTLIEDPEVINFVDKVGQQVVEHLDIRNFPYHFYVVESGALNAFAAPAGHVFINRGLIEIMDSECELGGVLGHEIAHVQCRHIAQRMARA
jgi:predicted Zn-dependent protease